MFHVYSKPSCGFCVKAKELLARRGVEYKEIDITLDEDALSFIKEEMNLRTVPQIFGHNATHIGGYDDLVEWFKREDEAASIF